MKKYGSWILALLVTASISMADDLTGADAILCSAAQATICDEEEGCESGPPWAWNIPLFIEIDLAKKTMGTTAASGEDRSTPIRTLERTDGMIFLQGIEQGRAFSFVIDETHGLMTVAVAREAATVSVFGACTPIKN
ncbi:MAG: hypothetical protein OEV00_02670 [Acidobacteriota bacterium]|nr:hypothetical protein [Acidobacteriota bacterium]MDH3784213.1 hypothetical protein [Acidobacteriota bacterium]